MAAGDDCLRRPRLGRIATQKVKVSRPEMFYFICYRCNAKWFAPGKKWTCPRCGKQSTSTEERDPPWRIECADSVALSGSRNTELEHTRRSRQT